MAVIPFFLNEVGPPHLRDFIVPINPYAGGPMRNYTSAQQGERGGQYGAIKLRKSGRIYNRSPCSGLKFSRDALRLPVLSGIEIVKIGQID
ncbi:MAG: hypothetical protein K0M47_00540 [Rhizobium sp.]|nr:hypothetical protein [Rhizobium sp.]